MFAIMEPDRSKVAMPHKLNFGRSATLPGCTHLEWVATIELAVEDETGQLSEIKECMGVQLYTLLRHLASDIVATAYGVPMPDIAYAVATRQRLHGRDPAL